MRKVKIKYGKDGYIRVRCPYCGYINKLTGEVDKCDHYLFIEGGYGKGEYALFTKEGVGLKKKPYQERKQECDEVDQEKSDDTLKEWQRGFFGYASYMTIKYHK